MALDTSTAKLTSSQRVEFLDQLSLLLEANVPLVDALLLLQNTQPHPAVIRISHRLIEQIGQGQSLAAAMKKAAQSFDAPTRALVAVGEASGTLPRVLREVVNDLRSRQVFIGQLTQALAYPMGLFVIALAVSAVLLWWVVPQFQALFEGFGTALPMATQTVIHLSQMVQSLGWHAMLATILAIAFAIYSYHHHAVTKRCIETWLDRLPLLGVAFKQQRVAKTSQVLSTLLEAGLPLTQAMSLASQATFHSRHRRAIEQVTTEIKRGQSFSSALADTGAFDPLMVHLCSIGEQSGQIAERLRQVDELLRAKVNIRLRQLSSLMEPFMMVTVGLLVGGLLIALYLPIFNMTDVMM